MSAFILNLPDELLVSITLVVDVTGLRSFIRTNGRFRAVAGEALVQSASLSTYHILNFVNTLDQTPTLARHVKHLRFQPLTAEVQQDMAKAIKDKRVQVNGCVYERYCRIFREGCPYSGCEAWLGALRNVELSYSVGLSLSIAQTTNHSTLTLGINMLGLQLVKQIFRSVQHFGAHEWVKQTKVLLYARLKSVTLYEDQPFGPFRNGGPDVSISLERFSSLKRLSVSCILLETKDPSSRSRKDLPASLQFLRITNVRLEDFPVRWVKTIFTDSKYFQHLGALEL